MPVWDPVRNAVPDTDGVPVPLLVMDAVVVRLLVRDGVAVLVPDLVPDRVLPCVPDTVAVCDPVCVCDAVCVCVAVCV